MLDFFRKIIEFLDAQGIPYMLSGSVAMSLYVMPRATRDIDFVVHLQPQHVDDFVEYFSGDYYCSKSAVVDAIDRGSMFNVIDHASSFKADFVVLKNTEYRLAEFERRRPIDYFGIPVQIVSPEDLLISKLIWIQEFQSAVQMEDIKNVAQIDGLDFDYVNYWITKLNLSTFDLL